MAAHSNQAVAMPIVEVARSRGKGSQSLDAADRLVLIVGEWQTPQQVCAAYGYTPMFVHITQLSHDTKIQSYTEQLRSGRFCLLWMSLPSQTRANVWGETGTNKRLRQMKCWIEHAAKSSTPAVLYGFCGKAWKGDILESLLVNFGQTAQWRVQEHSPPQDPSVSSARFPSHLTSVVVPHAPNTTEIRSRTTTVEGAERQPRAR